MKKISSLTQNSALIFILIVGLIINHTLILSIVSILATIPVAISALKSLIHRKITVDLLATIALVVSLIHQEWSSAAFINLMITFARIFGDYTEDKARQAVQSLLKLRPEVIKIIENGQIVEIPASQAKLGQLIVVESGDRIAIDGVVISGNASIDQSSLTGESLPVPKNPGDQVYSSTLNLSGTLQVKAEKIGADTSLEKIIALMQSAQNQKISIKPLIDNFTTWYILATFFTAVLIYVATHNLNLVLSLLLITCADDIAVAIPLAYWAAIARSAKHGVIIKGGVYLEGLSQVQEILVDKTGTVTQGNIQVEHQINFEHYFSTRALAEAASIASVSSHPISKAIIEFSKLHHLKYQPLTKFEEIPGKGIIAQNSLGDKFVYGNLALIQSEKIPYHKYSRQIKQIENQGHILVFLAKNGQLVSLFGLGDQLRHGMKSSVAKLKKLGIKDIIMLTGDNPQVAKAISDQVGITNYQANLSPQDKLQIIKSKLNPNYKIAYVGDGINDGAALAQADIGIAMGAIGTDTAIEAADIALMDDDFNKIYTTIKLSHTVKKIVIQDFIIWGVVNFIGLMSVFVFNLNPSDAAAFNFVTDFIPLLNSLRILRYRFKQ